MIDFDFTGHAPSLTQIRGRAADMLAAGRAAYRATVAEPRPGPIVPREPPFALLYFHGGPVALNRYQFEQAARDGGLCGCGECLCCTARGHALANRYPIPR